MADRFYNVGILGVNSERRLNPRHKLKSIIYVELGDGNGGVITDLSAGGLAVQAAMEVVNDSLPIMKFQLPRTRNRVETPGQVAWKSASKKMAGVKFVDLPELACAQIQEWISLETSPDASPKKEELFRKKQPEQIRPSSSEPVKFIRKPIEISDASKSAPGPHVIEPAARNDFSGSEEERQDVSENTDQTPVRASKSAKARVRLKRYLVNDRAKILLHDFVSEETQKWCAEVGGSTVDSRRLSIEELVRRIREYEQSAEVLISIMTTGCFWGEKDHALIWAKLLERVANVTLPPQLAASRFYPALVLLYAGGVAAVAGGKYSTVATLLLETKIRDSGSDSVIVHKINSSSVFDEVVKAAVGGNTHHAPVSLRLHQLLREPLKDLVPFDSDYDEAFDRFEYLSALVWIDENPKSANLDWVPVDAPLGRFASLSVPPEAKFASKFSEEITELGKDWPPLRAGLLGGSLQRLRLSKKRIDAAIASLKPAH